MICTIGANRRTKEDKRTKTRFLIYKVLLFLNNKGNNFCK